MLRWGTTDTASAKLGVKSLVYGEAGTGKTKMVATLPAPVIASAESGLLSLRQFSIPYVEIRDVSDLTDFYRWCANSAEAKQFASVGIDSLSEIGEVVLANARKLVKDPRQAYGELIEKMEMVVRSFRDLPGKHVYVTAKSEPMKDEMTGIVRYAPSMPGSKLGPKLPYYFDEVFRAGVGTYTNPQGAQQRYHYLQTQADMQYVAKDRSGALDPMEPPDMTHIIRKILGATA